MESSKNPEKQFIAKIIITLFIVSILIISGPGQAISVVISGLDRPQSQPGDPVNFTISITINDRDKFVPMTNITLDITGARSFNGTFQLDGTPISSDPIISIMPVLTPQPDQYGYGYGYGVDFGYGYGYNFGYGYGYGYRYGAGGIDITYKYNVSINTTSLPFGSYTAVASLNTGKADTKKSFDSAPAIFEIIPVLEVNIDILGNKINPRGNGDIKVAILSNATFNATVEVDASSVMARFGQSGATLKQPYSQFEDVNNDSYLDLLLHFKIEETGIQCGDTKASLTGKTITGLNFIGNDSFITIGCDSKKDDTGISSGGGGGGGGGGRSGENQSNIDVIEKYDLQISKDALTSYSFTHAKNPIMLVNITGNTSLGIITASIEVLKHTSTLVNFPPEGLIYMNADIWIGTAGYATPKNIKKALIKFRVLNSWMSENSVPGSSIVLTKWDGTAWIELETKLLSKDDNYSYFEGETKAFSPFAIVAKVSAEQPTVTTPDQTETVKAVEVTETSVTPVTPPAEPLAIPTWPLILIIGVVVVYFFVVKK